MSALIRIKKAQDTTKDNPVESVEIHLDEAILTDATLSQMETYYDLQAQALADVLIKTLPGGTLSRLTAKLLQNYAGYLAVPINS